MRSWRIVSRPGFHRPGQMGWVFLSLSLSLSLWEMSSSFAYVVATRETVGVSVEIQGPAEWRRLYRRKLAEILQFRPLSPLSAALPV